MGLAVKAATTGIKEPAASERGLCKIGPHRTPFFRPAKKRTCLARPAPDGYWTAVASANGKPRRLFDLAKSDAHQAGR